MKKHPIEYYDPVTVRLNGRSVQAYRVGSYLFILKFKAGYRVCKSNKTALIKCHFSTLDHAIEFAEWLIDTYGEYFCIWDDYPDVDIMNMAKWTINDGLNLYETLQLVNEIPKINSLEQVNTAYYTAKEFAHDKWTCGFRNYLGTT